MTRGRVSRSPRKPLRVSRGAMTERPSQTVTEILRRVDAGDEQAKERLFEVVYDELRSLAGGLMRGERSEHTLQPTALVHEAAVRLMSADLLARLRSRSEFFAASARAMRQILIDHARKRRSSKRGGSAARVPLDDAVEGVERASGVDLLIFDEALEELAEINPRLTQVVVLRFFGGHEMREIAENLGVSLSTVESDWRFARAWLKRRLDASDPTRS